MGLPSGFCSVATGMNKLLLKQVRLISAEVDRVCDVLVAGGVIERIDDRIPLPPGATERDGTGKLLFPGFVDPHVHVTLPFMGTMAKDDWASASRAAICGGTTTLIEMICPVREQLPLDALEAWQSKARGISHCDYTFHFGVTALDKAREAQIEQVVASGVASLKVFLAYAGALDLDDEGLDGVMALARRLGVIVTAHCENAVVVRRLQQMLLAEGKTGPEFHEPSRPEWVEAMGVRHLTGFARAHGTAVYIVHTSCRPAVEEALAAREQGVRVWVEALIQHLLLDRARAEAGGFEGAKYVMSPPLRDARNLPWLWEATSDGRISTVATDHAPFDFHGQKDLGRHDFTKIPNGIPSLEERVKLLYTHGVVPNRISLQRLVQVASTEPAKLFGLYPRKGTIAEGSDADLVLFDPAGSGVISARTHQSAVDYSAFEGWNVSGQINAVWVGGKALVEAGRWVGAEPRGRFLARKPGYF
jgi:dihydropyrimidinase